MLSTGLSKQKEEETDSKMCYTHIVIKTIMKVCTRWYGSEEERGSRENEERIHRRIQGQKAEPLRKREERNKAGFVWLMK